MTIKTKESKAYIALIWFVTFLTSAIFFVADAVILASIYLLIFSLFSAFYTIVIGRTIFLSNKGCTIMFMNTKKFYSWNELYIKIEDCTNKIALRGTGHNKCLMISPKKMPKSVFTHPNFYSLFISPFSFVFVYLFTKNRYQEKNYNGYYVVEEQVLITMLNEWGINIET